MLRVFLRGFTSVYKQQVNSLYRMGPKHFISDSSFLVDEMCKSLLYQNPGLKYDPQYKGTQLRRRSVYALRHSTDTVLVLSRTKDDEEARVAIVSGGKYPPFSTR